MKQQKCWVVGTTPFTVLKEAQSAELRQIMEGPPGSMPELALDPRQISRLIAAAPRVIAILSEKEPATKAPRADKGGSHRKRAVVPVPAEVASAIAGVKEEASGGAAAQELDEKS